jgi:hypothetical protein
MDKEQQRWVLMGLIYINIILFMLFCNQMGFWPQ